MTDAPVEPPGSAAVAIRLLRGTDASACADFFRRLDRRDVRLRFGLPRFSAGSRPARVSPNEGASFAALDGASVIVGVLDLVCQAAGTAEVALVVRADCRRRGIGRALLGQAIEWAAGRGLSQLVGYVLHENQPMLALAHATGFESIRSNSYFVEVRRPVAAAAA